MVGGIAGSNLGTIQGCTADDIRINSKTKNNTAQIERIYNLGAKALSIRDTTDITASAVLSATISELLLSVKLLLTQSFTASRVSAVLSDTIPAA